MRGDSLSFPSRFASNPSAVPPRWQGESTAGFVRQSEPHKLSRRELGNKEGCPVSVFTISFSEAKLEFQFFKVLQEEDVSRNKSQENADSDSFT